MEDQTNRRIEQAGGDADALNDAIKGALTQTPSRGYLPWKADSPRTPIFFRYYCCEAGRTGVMAVALDFGKDQAVPTAETVPVSGPMAEARPAFPGASIDKNICVRKIDHPPTRHATRYVIQKDGEEERDLWIGTREDGTPVKAPGRDPVHTSGW